MKAVFKGYKKPGFYKLTVGKTYELSTTSGACGYTEVTDDNNFRGTFIPGDTYDFEVLIPDEISDGYKLMIDNILKNAHVNNKRLKYFINYHEVDKDDFHKATSYCAGLESMGVDTSPIKFEVKFE